jgi:arabinogalactan endo-1,4-beta-galactosidase
VKHFTIIGKSLGITLTITLFFFFQEKATAQFAKGADIGWLSQMEASGKKFYDKNGTQRDLLDILKMYNINAVRFRVWVNPTAGYCNKADVIKQATRCKNAGFRIMIDFHYSDSWADPGQQTKPAAWSSYTIAQLKTAVATHTTDVLSGLKDACVYPEWIQIGNETNNGMLWPEGQASSSMANFAGLVTSGYDAAKTIFPDAKMIVHISNGYDNSLFRWMFDGLKSNSAKWDAIGMSLYPEQAATSTNYQTYDPACLTNLKDMVSRYSKDVLMSEIGISWSDANTAFDYITDILAKNRTVPRSLGAFYWEPECYNGWQGYQKGAFDNSGKPTHAMDAFLEGKTTPNKAPTVSITSPANNASFITNSTITLNANASDVDGTISKVDFFYCGVKLGEDATSPYSYAWANVPNGSYPVYAVAYDDNGTITNSSLVTITVSKTVTGLELEEKANSITCYPNPFHQHLTLQSPGPFSYSISDMTGNSVENGKGEDETLCGMHLPAGLYVVKVQGQGGGRYLKVTKQ